MWLIIIIASIIILVSIFININLLRKTEKQEDIIEKQNNFIIKLQETIEFSSKSLDEIDAKGSFKADDEIGWFFDGVKKIQVMLNEFLINEENNNGEKNKEKKGI